eukprot:scaffold84795_cov56-Attheya_sp.AAC.1
MVFDGKLTTMKGHAVQSHNLADGNPLWDFNMDNELGAEKGDLHSKPRLVGYGKLEYVALLLCMWAMISTAASMDVSRAIIKDVECRQHFFRFGG